MLGAGSIALISLAAVLTLRGFPAVAGYGWSSIAFYLLGAVFFFVPLALVSAELATGWPRAGGLFAWVTEAFGDRSGFLAVWFEWVENIVWFPTVLSFVAATVAYVVDPGLADDRLFLVIAMLAIFWALTLANLFGMRWTARLNNPAVVLGTLLPAALLIGLGVYWVAAGRHSAIPFHAGALVPDVSRLGSVVFFSGVLLGFAGIEMAGFHAREMRDPARDYPRAVFMSAGLILGISVLATLSIALIVPRSELSLVAGLPQAFEAFFGAIGVGEWATKVMAALTGLGTLALISTWLLGPAKGLYAAETAGDLPPGLHYVNRRHVPVAILVAQGVLSSLFALLFLFVPSINTSYWMLSALTTQILVLMYILVFAAALRLRYTQPDAPRPYAVPGGLPGIWLAAGLGLVGSAFGLVIGFVPPAGLAHWPAPLYAAAMAGGIAACSLPPFILDRVKKPGWTIAHPDTVLLDAEPSDVAGAEALRWPVVGSARCPARILGSRGTVARDPGGVLSGREPWGDSMATVADGTFAGEGAPGVPPPIGCGESRLVLVGGSTCAGPSELGGAGRAPTARRRPALIVLDLDRRTFVIAPHVASGEVRVALIGELDIGTSPMFVDAIALALRHRPALLVLDMRRLSFIDVRGAGAIATASERMGEWGGELLAREAPAATRRALGLCGLDHLMSPLRVPPASLRRIPRGKASSRPAWEQTASA